MRIAAGDCIIAFQPQSCTKETPQIRAGERQVFRGLRKVVFTLLEGMIYMRLTTIKLKNFRCYRSETVIDVDGLTVFVGKNDSGKSSLFDALDIFFNEPKGAPDKDDLNVYADDRVISISCVFDKLPKHIIIDATTSTTLEDEYMLNSAGQLEIKKEFTVGAKISSKAFAVALHPTRKGFSDLLEINQTTLKARAKELEVDLSGIDQRENTQIRSAIWKSTEDLSFDETEIDLSKDTAKAIWDKIKTYLPLYALFKSDRPSTDQDAEAQDPMKAAIKEAIAEQEHIFLEIEDKVKTQVQQLANRTVAKIREMNPDLANTLNPRVTTKKLDSLFGVSLTGEDEIPINKRGSGTRRLILLNFFRAKAEEDSSRNGRNVIYAIEEPETSQHPNNQKMLVDAFEDLIESGGCQVLLTTHTPVLARRFSQSSLRLISGGNGSLQILPGTDETACRKIVHTLGVLPDHDVKVFIGVEGKNDINFLQNISRILSATEKDIPDLNKLEAEGQIVFVPFGGSCIELWISRLQGFDRKEFYIMDRDNVPPIQPKYQLHADRLNSRQNCVAWTTNKRELENYIHKDLILAKYPNYCGTGADFEDVPSLFAQAVHESSESQTMWGELDSEKKEKKISGAKKRLNTDIALQMNTTLLSEVDEKDEIRVWLRAIGEAIKA